MRISTIIIGIILFAIVTAIIYCWGMYRQQRQSSDLMNLLVSTGQSKVKKRVKKQGSVTRAEVEQLCDGMHAKMPFSGNKAVVQNKEEFAEQLLSYMVKTGQLRKDGEEYYKV